MIGPTPCTSVTVVPGGFDGVADLGGELVEVTVVAAQLDEQFPGERFAFDTDRRCRVDARQDRGGLLGTQTPRELAFCQEAQRVCSRHTVAGPAGDQVVMTLGQQAQHGDVILDGDVVQVAFAQRDDRHRSGIMTVRLVGLFVVQHAHPRRQLRVAHR